MLPSLRARMGAFLTRHRLRRAFWLGRPVWATVVGTPADGYLLAIKHTNGVEWIPLGPRTGLDDHPDPGELAAAHEALTARRLAVVLPWQLDARANLTAPVRTAGKESPR